MYGQEQIHVRSARQLIGNRPAVHVAIIAARPQSIHPALADVEITSVSLAGGTAPPPADNYTSALAALIAGSGGGGFTGVAPGMELLTISVLDENLTSTNATVAAGVDRAVLGGARINCLGIGGVERSNVIDDAIADTVAAGVVVVAPAGNGGDETPQYPAASAGVLAVGAVDYQRRLPSWTSRGAWVHVMAPGNEMLLLVGEDGYAAWSGTSWSCAIVSGAAALLLQANSQLTPVQIKDLLVDTGQAVGGPSGSMDGKVIGIYAAVRRALSLPAIQDDPASVDANPPGSRTTTSRQR
jgi:subtilisin family serine protease